MRVPWIKELPQFGIVGSVRVCGPNVYSQVFMTARLDDLRREGRIDQMHVLVKMGG